jgi:hypothetical protein
MVLRPQMGSVLVLICWQSAKLSAKCCTKFGMAGLTPMAHQEPAAHLNITYQTHIKYFELGCVKSQKVQFMTYQP